MRLLDGRVRLERREEVGFDKAKNAVQVIQSDADCLPATS